MGHCTHYLGTMMYGMEHGLGLGALNAVRACVSAATDIQNVRARLTIKCPEASLVCYHDMAPWLSSSLLSKHAAAKELL
jgi:hypothetical protein